jgi:hypothetical protein
LAPGAAEAPTSAGAGRDIDAKTSTGRMSGCDGGNVGKGDDKEPPWRTWRADAVSGNPADVAMSRLTSAGVGSVKSRRASPYEVLCGRLLIVGRMGAE